MVTRCFGQPDSSIEALTSSTRAAVLAAKRLNHRWKQSGRQDRVSFRCQMDAIRLQIFSANATARDWNDFDASAAQPRNDGRKLRFLISLTQSARIERAADRAEQHNSGAAEHGLIEPSQHSRIGIAGNPGVYDADVVTLPGKHPLQLRRKGFRTGDTSAGDIAGAQRNDLGPCGAGKTQWFGKNQNTKKKSRGSGNHRSRPGAFEAVLKLVDRHFAATPGVERQ